MNPWTTTRNILKKIMQGIEHLFIYLGVMLFATLPWAQVQAYNPNFVNNLFFHWGQHDPRSFIISFIILNITAALEIALLMLLTLTVLFIGGGIETLWHKVKEWWYRKETTYTAHKDTP